MTQSHYPSGHILLDKYRIEAFIGSGAFAEVYRATHLALNAPRALKILRRDASGISSTAFGDYLERFRLEVQPDAALDHPNLVRVYDFEQDNDLLVLVMAYAGGGSLVRATFEPVS